MSWFSDLFKWIRPVGDAVAAPFTGGATLADLPSAIGGLTSGDDGGGDAWDADGNFTGDSSVSGDDGGGGLPWAKILKHALPGAAGAIKGGLSHADAQQQLQLLRDRLAEDTAARQQRTALAESQLDPFRGYMAQGHDAARLDMMANGDFTSKPVQADAKYGAGLNVQPNNPWAPSDATRALLRAALTKVAAGDKVPTMTDPANYGKLPVVSMPGGAGGASAVLGAPSAPGSAIDPSQVTPLNPDDDDPKRRRIQPTAGDSPWLV